MLIALVVVSLLLMVAAAMIVRRNCPPGGGERIKHAPNPLVVTDAVDMAANPLNPSAVLHDELNAAADRSATLSSTTTTTTGRHLQNEPQCATVEDPLPSTHVGNEAAIPLGHADAQVTPGCTVACDPVTCVGVGQQLLFTGTAEHSTALPLLTGNSVSNGCSLRLLDTFLEWPADEEDATHSMFLGGRRSEGDQDPLTLTLSESDVQLAESLLEPLLATDMGVRVKVFGYEGMGVLRFVGKFHVQNDDRLGVELDLQVGRNNGTVGGRAYFACASNHGVLVPPRMVRRALDDSDERTAQIDMLMRELDNRHAPPPMPAPAPEPGTESSAGAGAPEHGLADATAFNLDSSAAIQPSDGATGQVALGRPNDVLDHRRRLDAASEIDGGSVAVASQSAGAAQMQPRQTASGPTDSDTLRQRSIVFDSDDLHGESSTDSGVGDGRGRAASIAVRNRVTGLVAVHGLAREAATLILETARTAGPGGHLFYQSAASDVVALAVRGLGSGGREAVEHFRIIKAQRDGNLVVHLEAATQHKFKSLEDLRQHYY